VKLRQLRTFVAVAEGGSFVAASRALGIAQPALSRQVSDLERELGVALFERGPRGASLTREGEVFLPQARRMLELNERALALTREAAGADAGELLVAHAELLRRHEAALAAAAAAFADRFPGVDLVSLAMTSAEQWRALQEDRIEVGVGYGVPPAGSGLSHATLADVPVTGVLLPAAHPLAARERVRLRELAELPLLLFRREVNPPLFDGVIAALRERGLEPRLRHGMHSHLAREAAVRAGQGWMIAVDGTPEDSDGVAARPVEDAPIPATLSAWWRGGEPSRRVGALVEIAREALSPAP
jgi:DNA-binding transcriptional LysR family regulator